MEYHRHRRPTGFLQWMMQGRLLHMVIILLATTLITASFFAHYYISNMSVESDRQTRNLGRRKLEHPEELINMKPAELMLHVDELKRIKASVNNELRELEGKRQKLYTELNTFTTQIDSLKSEVESRNVELEQLRVSIQHQRTERDEMRRQNTPEVQAPLRVLPPLDDPVYVPPPGSHLNCRMHNCFDFSRCSLTSKFPVFVYSMEDYTFTHAAIDKFLSLSVMHAFDSSPHMTLDPNMACLFVVLVGDVEGGLQNTTSLEYKLNNLPYWNGDGRNHLLVVLPRYPTTKDVFSGVNTGRALIAQSAFMEQGLRPEFDIVVPPALGRSHGDTWSESPLMVPAHRKYLLSFQGDNWGLRRFGNLLQDQQPKQQPRNEQQDFLRKLQSLDMSGPSTSQLQELLRLENSIMKQLKSMQGEAKEFGFQFDFMCQNAAPLGYSGEWELCGSEAERATLLERSTFSLIIAPMNYSLVSSVMTQFRIFEAVKHGAVPVVLGSYVEMPFSEILNWRKAAIFLPKQRITELHYLLMAVPDFEILEMRRQGRIIWDSYLSSTKNIIDTLLAVVRTRLGIPAFPTRSEPAPSVFNDTFHPFKELYPDAQVEPEEILGPIEPPYPSPEFRQNFTFTMDAFRQPGDPFHLYPYTPFQPVMPGEAKFVGSEFGFRPIGDGAGGSGKEFNEALGGNLPREQFTIVILTYERDVVLLNALARFRGLPHLNKIVVVWNSPRQPADDLRWPDIGVDIHVVRTSKNSLNNRFLPYDVIETEAILSIDDDAHLRHDEIIFGFRVWRETRDRIVGFPGRFHAWDLNYQNWLYNSNYSCELSMVLTGAAFFHKYYAYLYSYVMPQAIRDKVDEYLNCEDIAMNFLVSHITRKPPIKVTSRWTFRCPGCPKALSVEDEHFIERHQCINFFTKVYGYMPLLYTQFRADSVLFKTRISHDKQKCFKYV